jgi:hypothetical protein
MREQFCLPLVITPYKNTARIATRMLKMSNLDIVWKFFWCIQLTGAEKGSSYQNFVVEVSGSFSIVSTGIKTSLLYFWISTIVSID